MAEQFAVTTQTGRSLSATVGGEGREVVFVLHGTPSSGLLFEPNVVDAARRGLRLVSYDRPGYGGSDRHPGRCVADAASDVVAIADHLGVERFAVWGHSGGAPHALACAALLGDRVAACAALSGPAPYDAERFDWWRGMGEENVTEFRRALGREEEFVAYLNDERDGILSSTPQQLRDTFGSLLSEADAAVMTDEFAGFLHTSFRDSVAPGVEGWRDDDYAFVEPWGFDLASITTPTRIYHGAHDGFVPFAHGQWLAQHVAGADAHLSGDEGHLSLYIHGASDCHAWFSTPQDA
jgi:pimeloyl-ACP methyl ester carboxylesterase